MEYLIKLFLGKLVIIKAAVCRCSTTQVFLKISQNSQENTSVRGSFLTKLKASSLLLYQKRDTPAFL